MAILQYRREWNERRRRASETNHAYAAELRSCLDRAFDPPPKPEPLITDATAEIAMKHSKALGAYKYYAELNESLLLTQFLNGPEAEQRNVLTREDGARPRTLDAAIRRVARLEAELGERSTAVPALKMDMDSALSFEGIEVNSPRSTDIAVEAVSSRQRQRYAHLQRQPRLAADVCRISGGRGNGVRTLHPPRKKAKG